MASPFTAIRHPIAIAPDAGRLQREIDYEAYIRQLIRQVLLTSPGERINRPDFGAGLRRLVFAPLSPATASLAQTTIYEAITATLDTLIRLEDVRAVTQGDNRLEVQVTYILRACGERRFLNVEVAPEALAGGTL
jgi:phage baseplate assembly protein W